MAVEIYTTKVCPYCVKAKALLDAKSISYTEIDVSNDPETREKMVQRASGRKSVPQIFVISDSQEIYIGGCDDLHELNSKGELDRMLEI